MIAPISGRVYLPSLNKEVEAVISIESDKRERVVTTYHVINPDSECPDDLNPDINDKYLFELSVYKQDDRLLLKRWKCLPLGTWEAFNAKNSSALKVVFPSSSREISNGQDRRKIFDSEGKPKNHEIPGFRSDGAQLTTEDSLNRGLRGKFYAPPTKNWQVLQGYEREDFARNNGRKCYVLSPKEPLLQSMIDKPMISAKLFECIRKAEEEIAQKKLDKKDVQDLDMEIAAEIEEGKSLQLSDVELEPISLESELSSKLREIAEQDFEIINPKGITTESDPFVMSTEQISSEDPPTSQSQAEDRNQGCLDCLWGLAASLYSWVCCWFSKEETC